MTLICIAVCAGSFGVRGEVKIKSFTGNPEDCFSYGPLKNKDGDIVLTVKSHRPIKNGFAAMCEGIATPEQAQAINNMELYVTRADMPTPDEDEFYFEDLIGCEVKTTDGRRMGKVLAVHNYGAGDLLEISGGKDKKGNELGEFYHAFTKKTVPSVDIKAGRIVIFIEDVISERDQG